VATRVTADQAVAGRGQSSEPQPWTISSQDDGSLAIIVISLHRAESADERDALLGAGIVATVEELAAIGDRRTIVDVRTSDAVGSERAWEGFIQAARGLVQSLALERGSAAGPINLMISSTDQEDDRRGTVAYLGSDNGDFSWGACYDLRGETT
jgi:hypothetical protein